MVCVRGFEFFPMSISFRFRIVVGRNYFSILHTLSAPREITVLPLQKMGEGKRAILTYWMMYSKIS